MPPHRSGSNRSAPARLLEFGCALLAVAGVTLTLLPDYRQIRTTELAGVDFRSIYVSLVLFAHGQDPYAVDSFRSVYRAGGLPAPVSLFGHMPVYPPTTFALLLPLARLSGPAALWVWLVLSGFAVAFAIAMLARLAGREFGLSWPWRLGLVGLCAADPLVAFGLQIGNISNLVCALCIIAVCDAAGHPIFAALALAIGLLLKPHLAIWVVLAFALIWGAQGRRVAAGAVAIATAFTAVVFAVLAVNGHAMSTVHNFPALLAAEQGSGSMSIDSTEKLFVGAQITDIATIPAPFAAPHWIGLLLRLVVASWALAAATWIYRRRRGGVFTPEQRLTLLAALFTAAMALTYHRALDANLLLILLPVILARLRRDPRDFFAIVLAALYASFAFGPSAGSLPDPTASVRAFLLFRQAALLTAAMFFVLLALAVVQIRLPDKKKAA